MLASAINLKKWLEENEHLLKPPVANYCIQRGGYTIMIVGGPNERTDYHVNQTPEWFYQYKGKMDLRVVDEGNFRTIEIGEGSIFLLPPNIPHSPVRYANTVGIVVEQDRPSGLNDMMRWYCDKCSSIVREVEFYMSDLGTQVKDAIDDFDKEPRYCDHCGTRKYSRPL